MNVVRKEIDDFITKHSVRKIFLVLIILFGAFGIIFTAVGTYSPAYSIKEVHFTNQMFYEKDLQYGQSYEPKNVSLVPDNNQIFTIAAYVLTPRGTNMTKFPTVIWSHGMVADAEMQLNYAQELACAGFKVIAVNLDGMGDSGGLWDLGLTDLQVIYSAVEYAAGLPDVDNNSIAVCGHSNGGYAATRAGIFDKTPLGTGGLIKSVCAIWTLSDMNSTIQQLVGANPVNNPSYTWLLPMFMGATGSSITPQDLLRRSVSDYANSTNVPNWCVLCGNNDEMSGPAIQYAAMASATVGQTTASQLKATVESTFSSNGYGSWNNTNLPGISYSNGTARKIEIWKGMDHLGEAMSPAVIQTAINWFVVSMHLDPNQHISRIQSGINVSAIWDIRFAGWSLLLIGLIASQLVAIVYVSGKLFPERKQKYIEVESEKDLETKPVNMYSGFLPPGLEEYMVEVKEKSRFNLFTKFLNTWKKKLFFWLGLMLCIAGGVAIFFLTMPPPITRIWIFNAYLWQFLFAGILMWAYALFTYYRYKKSRYYGPYVSLERVGGSLSGFVKGFLFIMIVVIVPLIAYNILASFLVMPKIFPRPAQSGIWGDLFIGMLMIWVLYLPFEVMIKTQLFPVKRKFPTKRGYWFEVLMNSLLVFLIWFVGYAIGMLFMGKDLLDLVFSGAFGGTILLTINILMFVLNAAMSFVTALIYQRTRNLFACSLYPVLIWGLFLFGKFFGIFAVF